MPLFFWNQIVDNEFDCRNKLEKVVAVAITWRNMKDPPTMRWAGKWHGYGDTCFNESTDPQVGGLSWGLVAQFDKPDLKDQKYLFDNFLTWYKQESGEFAIHGWPFVKGSKHVVARPGYGWIKDDPSIKQSINFKKGTRS